MEQEYTQQEVEKLLATNRALAEKVCELEEENIGLRMKAKLSEEILLAMGVGDWEEMA